MSNWRRRFPDRCAVRDAEFEPACKLKAIARVCENGIGGKIELFIEANARHACRGVESLAVYLAENVFRRGFGQADACDLIERDFRDSDVYTADFAPVDSSGDAPDASYVVEFDLPVVDAERFHQTEVSSDKGRQRGGAVVFEEVARLFAVGVESQLRERVVG